MHLPDNLYASCSTVLWETNGWQPLTTIPYGLLAGWSVYTALRWPCNPSWLTSHRQRLVNDAQWLGLSSVEAEASLPKTRCLHDALAAYLSSQNDWRVRLTLTLEGETWRDLKAEHQSAALILSVQPVEALQPICPPKAGYHLVTASHQRSWPLVKHGQLADLLALHRRHPNTDDVLLLNSQGQVSEAGFANVGLISDDGQTISTPDPKQSGALPGLTMGWLMAHLPPGCRGIYRPLYPAELTGGVFVCNALRGIYPVKSLNWQPIGWSQEATERLTMLQEDYAKMISLV